MIKEITKIYRFNANRTIKTVLDFTGKHYYIEDNGNLYWRNILLQDIVNDYGYVVNKLKDNNDKYYIIFRHQLVAQTFLMDSFQEGLTVDHINNNRKDNRVENLRWATAKIQANNKIRKKIKIKKTNYAYKKVQKYLNLIENQEEYFINNITPNFNVHSYKYLHILYNLYDIIKNNKISNDDLLNIYTKEFSGDINNRSEFFNFYYDKIKKYKEDKGILLIENNDYSHIDIKKFEEKFLNVPYKKKELKDFCIQEFAIKPEIFKNQITIDKFLYQLGYVLKYSDSGKILRKIENDTTNNKNI